MITILTGANNYLRRQELDKLVGEFVAEHGDLALEKLDGESVDFDRVHAALASPPFLASKKMVVLKDAAANKSIGEQIETLLKAADDEVDFVISEGKLDKRGVYYKTLKRQKGFKEFNETDEMSLVAWLGVTAKEQGAELSQSDARKLVDLIGPNQQLLASELEKLILYNKKISSQAIDQLVEASPRSTIFEMLEAAFGGNLKRALRLYAEQRSQRVDPQAMLALIAWQLHILALIKVAGNRTPGQIASEAGVSPYVVNKSITVAKRLNTAELKKLIHDTLILDTRLKTESLDADAALQNLLISIANN